MTSAASFTLADLPDLSGKTALVTGANSGIGEVTTRALASKGAHVIMACRNLSSAARAAEQIAGSTSVEELDLSSQESVAALADRVNQPIDLLVNNAGVMAVPEYRETPEGHELMFGANHLGHFALTGRLLPRLLETASPRVVTIASIAHKGGDAKVLEGNPAQTYHPSRGYSQSKLANLLFALELNRRAQAADSPLTSTAAHPGVAATGLIRDPEGMGSKAIYRAIDPLLKYVLQSAVAGARPTLYAAFFAEPGSYTGPTKLSESRGRIGAARLSPSAQDLQLASDLFDLSVEKTGVSFAL